jgi:predicted porin
MQKKLIALAVAGLASTAAFAQTNVTIYGIVDYGYTYRFDARGADSLINADRHSFNKPNSASQLNGGQQSGNRLGFKGTEDLGNGLKAVFLLEQGFNLDTGTQAGGGDQMFNRQAYVGLSGNFGTAVGGRLYTPHYTFVSGIDPFGAGQLGSYRNVFSPSGSTNIGNTSYASLMDPLRVDNAIAYISPSFGGFSVTAAFSNNAGGLPTSATTNSGGADSTNNNAQNNTVYAILGQYTGGALTAGLNYHIIEMGTAVSQGLNVKNVQNIDFGGTYDFKVVKVAALYSWNEIDYTSRIQGQKNGTINNYMLGATVPLGKFSVLGSYIYSDGNKEAGGVAQQLALGGTYAMSKRTNLYSSYAFIDNSDKRLNGVGDATASGSYAGQISGSGAGLGNIQPAGVWQQGFQIGLRHMF